jgi:hypothetical protein
MLTGRSGFTFSTDALEMAGLPVAQMALEVTTQRTESLSEGVKTNEELVAPDMVTPFFFHWYCGLVPPLTRADVIVTWVPAQTVAAEEVMVAVTGNNGLTIIVTGAETEGLPVAQMALEVSLHVTISLFTGE